VETGSIRRYALTRGAESPIFIVPPPRGQPPVEEMPDLSALFTHTEKIHGPIGHLEKPTVAVVDRWTVINSSIPTNKDAGRRYKDTAISEIDTEY
jgi:hypothetical protein